MEKNNPSAPPLEILKLLVQVAWADDILTDEEIAYVLAQARRWQIDEAEILKLKRHLRREQPLPPANIGLLREHRELVLRMARELARSDKTMNLDEEEMVHLLEDMLR